MAKDYMKVRRKLAFKASYFLYVCETSGRLEGVFKTQYHLHTVVRSPQASHLTLFQAASGTNIRI